MKKQTKLGLVLAAAAVISVSVASLVSARGWVQNGADWYYVDNSGEYVTETVQSSGNAKFYLGEDGTMQRDYFLEDYNGNAYYFGQNGAMVTNTWVAIESSRVENQDEYVPDNYWYYFQASGKAMKAASGNIKKTTIDGKKYGFNEYGQMVTGWVDSTGKVINPDDNENPFSNATYYAGGDNDGVLRAGWVTYYDGYDGDSDYAADYTNLYFYFNTSNNTKYFSQTKKINGRTYAFDGDGIMLSGWDVYKHNPGLVPDKTVYFSGEDDGHQVKKGWVYAVPTDDLDCKAYGDDEEKYMYFNASGEIVRDQEKKINGKYYMFNRAGIMKTGLVIWAPDGVLENKGATLGNVEYRYINTLDLDWATGEELSKKGIMRYGDKTGVGAEYFWVNVDGEAMYGANSDPATLPGNLTQGDPVKLRYYGSDGARKTGQNAIEFSDDIYTFYSSSGGDKGSGIFSKKYYSLGIQLKANQDIRYGIYNMASPASATAHAVGEPLAAQSSKTGTTVDDSAYRNNLLNSNYLVLNTGGAKQKGQYSAKKDADGNYWFIERGTDVLKGIWTVNVKSNASFGSNFKTRTVRLDDGSAELAQAQAWYGDGKSVTIATTGQIEAVFGDLFMDSRLNDELDDKEWQVVLVGKRAYFVLYEGYAGFGFQADINDQTNKWIPFGVFDNTNKTVIADPTFNPTEKKYHGYEVTPNNDYFLNCYWN